MQRLRRRLFSLLRVLVLHELEQRLCFAILVEQNPPYRVLSSLGQLVGLDVEHFSARVVAEDHEILQRSNRALPVDGAADDGGTPVEERIDVAVFDDGYVISAAARSRCRCCRCRTDSWLQTFHPRFAPAVTGSISDEALADVEKNIWRVSNPRKPLGIPHPRINLAERPALPH